MLEDRVLFIDGEAIILDKPAGLAVHPGPATRDSLEDFLPDLCFGFRRAPHPVHRLDRDTSGCLLLSRNPKAHKRFAAAFEASQVKKSYLAILAGVPEGEGGTIDLPLTKISSREAGWRMVPRADGQRAVTHWQRLTIVDGRALVRFRPETGRTHQLRVHAASGLGIPIAGDPVYGSGEATLLHAERLVLPRGDKPPVEATAPLPQSFRDAGFTDPEPGDGI